MKVKDRHPLHPVEDISFWTSIGLYVATFVSILLEASEWVSMSLLFSGVGCMVATFTALFKRAKAEEKES